MKNCENKYFAKINLFTIMPSKDPDKRVNSEDPVPTIT